MKSILPRLLLPLVLVLGNTFTTLANAAPLSEVDLQKVRSVIKAQLEAFAEDDAETAFETATPSVREAIGDSGRFLAMVRGAYPMVYRPAAVTFLNPQKDEGQVLQMVQITDGNAKSWLAVFALEQQPDATWRISGCMVAETRWRAA